MSSMEEAKFYFAVLLAQVLVFVATGCPDGWIQHSVSCYHFSGDVKNWVEAMTVCEIFGGELATIQSDSEESFLVNEIKARNGGPYFWIGGTDLMVEGEWVWAKTGERITKGYWYPGEPNSGHAENCLAIYAPTNYQWIDYVCNNRASYVCEQPFTIVILIELLIRYLGEDKSKQTKMNVK